MAYWQIAILAVIQGAAELLPVSSSAHVIVAERLMGLQPDSPAMTFLLVMLHTGTMFAVLCYFWPRWRALWLHRTGPADLPGHNPWHFPKMVVLATVCTGVLGLGLKLLIEKVILASGPDKSKAEVESLFNNLPLIAASLCAVGVFILIAGLRKTKAESWRLSPGTSVLIGLVQGLCLPLRGFSRSGATISTALCRDVSRRLAEDFSFALAVVLTPPVVVLELHRLVKQQGSLSVSGLMPLLAPGVVGMVLAFLAGLVALRLLSSVLERGRWKYFGVYCLVAAAVVLAVHFLQIKTPG
ncbi:MAG TPA: undecaprenyl-diphosphate phosphatase [Gemmataceae bacterium]|nr:undecaprenyl-diphosphate phosphatase [Gemmataceae bacterium]